MEKQNDILVSPDGFLTWNGEKFRCAVGKGGILEDKKEGDDGGSKRSSLPLDKLDEVLLKAKDKFLHKMKVLVMKADNLISKQLKSKKNL